MASVVLAGDTSGQITLSAPAVAGTNTITVPAATGTMATTADVAAAGFASGTRLGFQQTSAPTGWTKDTTAGLDDSIMRIVTGTASSGGSTAFSTFNAQTATAAFTLTTNEIPSHTHTIIAYTATPGSGQGAQRTSNGSSRSDLTSSATGGGGSHSHGITTAIKYYDFIIASKN